jgi:hypothetical protein
MRITVSAAADMTPDILRLHIELRHRELRHAVRAPRRWAHSVDHLLHPAELDHEHPDQPTAEEMAERIARMEERMREAAETYREQCRARAEAH